MGVDTSQEIFQRDYNMPTGLDKFDKSLLRKVQQKRGNDFGRKGASKYTHLTDQDTTNFDPRFRTPDHLSNKFKNQMAGQKKAYEFDKPTKRR